LFKILTNLGQDSIFDEHTLQLEVIHALCFEAKYQE